MKDEFLATISHELRTPLNAVLGWLHLMQTGQARSRDRGARIRVDRAQRPSPGAAHRRSARRVEGADRPTAARDARRCSLKTVLDGGGVAGRSSAATAKDVTPARHDHGARTRRSVRGDANRLRQVVWHLLANAIKFTPRGGAIDVTLETNDHGVHHRARHRSGHRSGDFLPRIFDRFTQADSSPTRGAGGLGVGLSLVRELVERHGGDISVANASGRRRDLHRPPAAAPRGSAGRVAPRRCAAARCRLGAARRRARAARRSGSRRTRACSRVVLRTARRLGARRRARSDEALEMLESWRPDVLVSDTASPDRDTYALVGKVQSLDADRGGRIPGAGTDHRWRAPTTGCGRLLVRRETRSAQARRTGGADGRRSPA